MFVKHGGHDIEAFCVDAANEHKSAVADSDGGPGELSSVVVIHLLHVCHPGAAVTRR